MNKKQEILDDFYQGKLTGEDLRALVDRGELDNEDVAAFMHLLQSLENKDEADARSFLEDLPTKEAKAKSNVLLMVAALLALMLFGWYGYSQLQQDVEEPKVEFSQFAYLYPADSAERSTDAQDEPTSVQIKEFEKIYAQGKHQEYIYGFEKMSDGLKSEDMHLRYISALMSVRKYDKLISASESIACVTDNCKDNKDWYQALGYLGSDQRSEAIRILEAVESRPKHLFFTDSKKLLAKIRQLD